MIDLFFCLQDIEYYNFVDGITCSVCDHAPEAVLGTLVAIFWFENDYTKHNTEKCHLLNLGK